MVDALIGHLMVEEVAGLRLGVGIGVIFGVRLFNHSVILVVFLLCLILLAIDLGADNEVVI